MGMEESFKKIFEGRGIAEIARIAGRAQNLALLASLGVRKLADRVNVADVFVGKDVGLFPTYAKKKYGVVVQDPKPKPDEPTPIPPIPPQPANPPGGTKRSRIQDGLARHWVSQLQKSSFSMIWRLYIQHSQLLTFYPPTPNRTSSRIPFTTDIPDSSLALVVTSHVREQGMIFEVGDLE